MATTLTIGTETFTFTPAAADPVETLAVSLAAEINGNSTQWTATTAAGVVRITPLTGTGAGSIFTVTIADTGATASVKQPSDAPLDFQVGGDIQLITESILFGGSASRA